MKVPNKTPEQMVEFWEKELALLEEEETKGITLWSRRFIEAKIDLWKEAVDVQTERSRQEAEES